MVPLTKQSLRIDSSVFESIHCRHRHVWVDIPIMHALNQINAALVIVQNPFKEVPFSPVIAGHFRAEHVRSNACTWAEDVIRAEVLVILFIAIQSV